VFFFFSPDDFPSAKVILSYVSWKVLIWCQSWIVLSLLPQFICFKKNVCSNYIYRFLTALFNPFLPSILGLLYNLCFGLLFLNSILFIPYVANNVHQSLDPPLWLFLQCCLQDIADIFNFVIVNFTFLCSNISLSHTYNVLSQLIRYARACSAYKNFSERGKLLAKKLMLQGYNESRLKVIILQILQYDYLVRYYKLSLAHMLNALFHTLC
jgi:hypothetical protein